MDTANVRDLMYYDARSFLTAQQALCYKYRDRQFFDVQRFIDEGGVVFDPDNAENIDNSRKDSDKVHSDNVDVDADNGDAADLGKEKESAGLSETAAEPRGDIDEEKRASVIEGEDASGSEEAIGVTPRPRCAQAAIDDVVKLVILKGPTQSEEESHTLRNENEDEDDDESVECVFARITRIEPVANPPTDADSIKFTAVQLHDLTRVKGSCMRAVIEFLPRHILTITPLYGLQDVEDTQSLYPGTFRIPNLRARLSLKMNQLVKVSFLQELLTATYVSDRMWVLITHVKNVQTRRVRYTGRLHNQPAFIVGVDRLDVITFSPENVLEIGKVVPPNKVPVFGAKNEAPCRLVDSTSTA